MRAGLPILNGRMLGDKKLGDGRVIKSIGRNRGKRINLSGFGTNDSRKSAKGYPVLFVGSAFAVHEFESEVCVTISSEEFIRNGRSIEHGISVNSGDHCRNAKEAKKKRFAGSFVVEANFFVIGFFFRFSGSSRYTFTVVEAPGVPSSRSPRRKRYLFVSKWNGVVRNYQQIPAGFVGLFYAESGGRGWQ